MLVDAKSDPSFVLEREDFAKALRGLKRLAKDQPAEFDYPDSLARTKTLADALGHAMWGARFDAYGDLVGIDYQVDKAPQDASDFWPVTVLEVLAKAGARGRVNYSADDYECVFELDAQGVYRYERESSFGLRVVADESVRATPGESLVVRVEAGDRIATAAPPNVKVVSDWGPTSSSVSFDPSPLRAGESRSLTLAVAEDARGSLGVEVRAGSESATWTTAVEPSADEIASPWVVIDRRSESSRSAMVASAGTKKALERLRRYAARNHARPGAAFLREIAEADSLEAALVLAGLQLRTVDRQQELSFVADRLPGAELHFIALLDRLAEMPGGRRCRISLSLAFDHSPAIWREYRVAYRGGIACSVTPRIVQG
ncbi:hypothetical protein ACNOYE_38635 [Nannocystaceae bacterium ST9]